MSNVNIRQLKDPASNEVFYPQTDVMGLVHNGEYGVEAVPTAGSVLPVQSGGVYDATNNYKMGYYLNSLGVEVADSNWFVSDYVEVVADAYIYWHIVQYVSGYSACIIHYDTEKNIIGYVAISSGLINGEKIYKLPQNVKFVRASFLKNYLDEAYLRQESGIIWKPVSKVTNENTDVDVANALINIEYNKVEKNPGVNLADPDILMVGYGLTTVGMPSALNSNYAITKVFFPIASGETYIQPYTFTQNMNIGAFVLYKADKCTIAKIVATGNSYTCTVQDVSDGVAYIRFTLRLGTSGYPTFFLAKSSTLPAYKAYTPIGSLTNEIEAEVTRATAAENALDESKLDSQPYHSNNLIDATKIVTGAWLLTDGTYSTGHPDNYLVCEDYIPVNGKNILVYSGVENNQYILTFNVYDSNKQRLPNRGIYGVDNKKYTYQNGDAYVRIAFNTDKFGGNYTKPFACYEDAENPGVLLPYDNYSAGDYLPIKETNQRIDNLISLLDIDGNEIGDTLQIPTLYMISNDVKPLGANTFWNPRDLSLSIYADHLFDWSWSNGEVRNIFFKENKSDHVSFVSPHVANGSPAAGVYNNGVDVYSRTVQKVLTTGYSDKTINVPISSILNSVTAEQFPKVLFIGDSVTASSGSTTPVRIAYNDNNVRVNPCTYYDYIWKLYRQDKEANSNTNFDFISLGTRERKITWNGNQYNSCNEGHGGWKTVDYLSAKTFISESPYSDSSNPFYDSSKIGNWTGSYATELNAAGVAFSLSKYLSRFKTLADDGTTRLTVGSTAGTLVTSGKLTTTDVCTPNIISIQLGFNDELESSLANIKLMVKAIRTEYPTIPIVISLLDEAGTYTPERYPQYNPDDIKLNTFMHQGSLLHHKMFTLVGAIQEDEFITSDSNIYFCGNYFIEPTAYGVAIREAPNAASLSGDNFPYDIVTGSGPHIHPSTYAHATWAYQFAALFKHILYSE